MKPFFGPWGPYSLSSYFLMFLLAVFVAGSFFYYMGRRENLRSAVLLDLIILGIISALLGGKLFHLASHPENYSTVWGRHFFEQFFSSGYISYGAILTTTLVFFLYLIITRQKILNVLDLCFLTAPLVIFFVRVGCLLAGCCYGKPTDFFLHLTFYDPTTKAGSASPGIPLHATQLYSMIKALLLFGLLFWRYSRRKFPGEVTLFFFLFYSFFRFLIEFLRGEPGRSGFFGGALTNAQLVMIPLFFIALIALGWKRHQFAGRGNSE